MRKKVKLCFIENDSARKTTFKKRLKGLLKKISELTTLCEIPACAIIYSPYNSRPEIWPSAHGVEQVVSHFRMMRGMEQTEKMVNEDIFLRQRISKTNEKLMKQRQENREKEVTQVMFQRLTGNSRIYLNLLRMNDLQWLIDQNLKKIIKKSETLAVYPGANVSNNNSHTGAVSVAVAVAVAVAGGGAEETVVVAKPPETRRFGGSMLRQQGFMDLINPPNQFQIDGGACGRDDMLLPFSHDQNFLFGGGPVLGGRDDMLLPFSHYQKFQFGGDPIMGGGDDMFLPFSDENKNFQFDGGRAMDGGDDMLLPFSDYEKFQFGGDPVMGGGDDMFLQFSDENQKFQFDGGAAIGGGDDMFLPFSDENQKLQFGGGTVMGSGDDMLLPFPRDNQKFQFGDRPTIGGGDDMFLPFSHENQNYNLWSNVFFQDGDSVSSDL